MRAMVFLASVGMAFAVGYVVARTFGRPRCPHRWQHRRANVVKTYDGPNSRYPWLIQTEVLKVCLTCGEVVTYHLNGSWTLADLSPSRDLKVVGE